VKITLNDSIAEAQRPQIQALVDKLVGKSEIIWLPSRFPRFVMFVEPGPETGSDVENGSIFESPPVGRRSTSSVVTFLEDNIKAVLTGKSHGEKPHPPTS
jgi:hypothetical protein